MPPTPAMSNHGPLPSLDQIDPAPVDGFGLGPGRHQDLPLVPPTPMPIGPFPMLPPPTPEVLAPLQRPQIPLRRIANEHHIPAVPPIPTIGPTPRHMSLPPKADAAVPTGPTLNPDLRLVVHELEEGSRVTRSEADEA